MSNFISLIYRKTSCSCPPAALCETSASSAQREEEEEVVGQANAEGP